MLTDKEYLTSFLNILSAPFYIDKKEWLEKLGVMFLEVNDENNRESYVSTLNGKVKYFFNKNGTNKFNIDNITISLINRVSIMNFSILYTIITCLFILATLILLFAIIYKKIMMKPIKNIH